MTKLFNWHWLSWVIKGALGIVVILLSAILSYAFFQGIEPPGMAIFPFAALTLTEGGLVAWIIIFSTMKHHPIQGLIAVLMIIFCFITTVTITFAELIQVFQDHSLVSNATVQNGTLILLEAMLGLHILAACSDFLIGKIEWLLKTLVSQETTERRSIGHPPALPAPQQHNDVPDVPPQLNVGRRADWTIEDYEQQMDKMVHEKAKLAKELDRLRTQHNGHSTHTDEAFTSGQTD